MTLDAPLILTTKDHRECHERWHRFKAEFADRVVLAKKLFDLTEASVRSFGPHLGDVWWISTEKLYEDVYGKYEPVDLLLDALHFPPHNFPAVDRTRIHDSVRKLIREHEEYGSDGNYMPRSVILGWVIRQHDLILSDIQEAA